MELEGAPQPVLIDSHCHLDLDAFDADREETIERARRAGVGCIINPGIDLSHSERAIALAEAHEEIFAAVGVHPTSSAAFDRDSVEALRRLAEHPKVVAIGEIGLDYHWDTVAPQQQAIALRAQLDLAAEIGLPVIIHNRKAGADLAEILESWVTDGSFAAMPLAGRPHVGVLHAFGADPALARRAYGWNFVLGLGGAVTFKNARELHRLVPDLRLDRLLLETDSPYLTPHPHRGKRNEPAHVVLVAERVAALHGMSLHDVAARTTETARALFGLTAPTGLRAGDPPGRHLPAR